MRSASRLCLAKACTGQCPESNGRPKAYSPGPDNLNALLALAENPPPGSTPLLGKLPNRESCQVQ